jgi:plastocyanin
VKADDGSFGSSALEQGGVFRWTFTKPGTYSYSCEMHPFMSGKVVAE